MYDDFPFDMEEVNENLDQAEVLSIFFPMFRKALVIDSRSNDKEGPMVRVMPMAASPQERLRLIRRMRSSFPRVLELTLIPWTRGVDSLVTLGIWDRIIEKLRKDGQHIAVDECESSFLELRRLERQELASAVSGHHYHTIWSARGT